MWCLLQDKEYFRDSFGYIHENDKPMDFPNLDFDNEFTKSPSSLEPESRNEPK